jgi:hypothetical protein
MKVMFASDHHARLDAAAKIAQAMIHLQQLS